MNTWIFSKNGQVTKPLELAAAKKYVVENHDAYGWHSSYTQWLPVHSISEFSALLPERDSSDKIPQIIVDEFLSKERALHQCFDRFNQELDSGEINARQFEQEITIYKQLTVNLSDEVKSNIDEIEQEYHALHKQLTDIKQTVKTSQQELKDVVRHFNDRIAEKSVIKAPQQEKASSTSATDANKPASNVKVLATKATSNADIESKAALTAEVQTIYTRPSKPVGAKVISTRSSQPMRPSALNESTGEKKSENAGQATEASSASLTKEQSSKVELSAAVAEKQSGQASGEQNSQANKIQTKLESGVKNIFKSVFTKDEQVDNKSKFAELVEKDATNNKVKQLTPKPKPEPKVEAEIEIESHADEASTAPRRRRRK
tara:strand:- start:122 stop:1246 length:1125 start_codon:yes stop_codon:yes gene_type:complete